MKCKIQKRVSNSLNKKNARINECTNWYVVTTNTATGEVISEEYVGTTCGNGGGSSSSESGGFGPYLCPSSFRSTTESTFDNGLGHTFNLGTTNVKAGYNNTIVNFNIQVLTKNKFHKNLYFNFALAHGDITMFGGITQQGDYCYLDEKAMRILMSRATDSGALFADESLLQTNLLTVYLNQLNQAAKSYLASFGFNEAGGTFYEATPFSIEGTQSNQAQQINSLFQYWFSDCSN